MLPQFKQSAFLLLCTVFAQAAQAEPNLVAHWEFDNAADVGEATVSTDLVPVGDASYFASGKIGGALSLDGNGDYLQVDSAKMLPAGLPVGDASYTIAAFIKTTNNGRNAITRWGVNGFRTTSAGEFSSSGGLLNYSFGGDYGQGAGGPTPGTIYDGTWHHAVATYDSGTSSKRLYLDGVEIGIGTVISRDLNVRAELFTLGSAGGGENFNGLIDDVRVYDAALSAAEVRALALVFTVTTIADEDNGSLDPSLGAGLSLREAIRHAPPGATINFDQPLDGSTITLGATELFIDKSLKIDASALPSGITIQGGGSSRLFQIGPNGLVEMHSLTLTDGQASAPGSGSHGGAIYNAGTALTLINCSFLNNTASNYGGALYNGTGSPTLTNCSFTENAAQYGGAILSEGSSPVLTGCTFTQNTATVNGGAVHNFTGSSSRFTNCSFIENTAATVGGAVVNYINSSPTYQSCIFRGNSAAYGGAMVNDVDSSPQITDCEFSGNTASILGGAILNQNDCFPALANCTFHANSATTNGGAIASFNRSFPLVVQSIIWDNIASGATNTASASVFNDGTSSTSYAFCLVGGYTKTELGGGNNLEPLDPLFLDAVGGDLRLSESSPARDAGNINAIPSTTQDLAGTPRIQGGIIDLGAYEAYVTFSFSGANVALETAILSELAKPSGPVTLGDLEQLTRLTARIGSINDVSALQFAVNLTKLDLYNNRIVDLSPLAGLTKLTRLDLSSNQIIDLSPLAGLAKLNDLNLSSNQIVDLSPLAGLAKLNDLNLSSNQIVDLSPLAAFATLEDLFLSDLDLSSNQIVDLSPLAGLTGLDNLDLSRNQIVDLSPLAGLTELTWIELPGNQIVDLNPLAGLTELNNIYLSGNQISDFSPLAGLPNVNAIDLSDNQISALSPLAGLPNGYYINLSDNQISNLIQLEGVGFLELEDNQISDLSPLAGNTTLEGLYVGGNQITDFSTLSELPALLYLGLSSSQISDLSPLAGLTALQELDINDNQIGNLSPLSGLTALRTLDLNANQVVDLSPLSGLTALLELEIDSNQIVDISPLSAMSVLVYLYAENNQITDLQPLTGLTALKELFISNNPDLLLYAGSPQQAIVDAFIAAGVDVIFDAGVEPPLLNSYLSKIDQPATTINIDVTTFGDWTVTEDADWLSADKVLGVGNATIVLTAAANPNANLRTANILFNDEIHVVRQRGLLETATPDFTSWLASYFTAEEIAEMQPNTALADSDGDKLSNYEEWKLSLDPSDLASRLITTLNIGETTTTFKVSPIPEDVEIGIQSSTTLLNWLPVTATIVRNGTTLSIQVEKPADKLFLQILLPEDPDEM